jgi:serine/threonine protein kinase
MTAARVRKNQGLPDIGDVLGGYCVIRCVGVGGMGAVYEVAHPTNPNARFAMKVMLPDIAEDPEFKARFLREARASHIIESQHVARVFEVGNLDSGTLFMVMELLTGTDLEQELRSRGPIAVSEAVRHVIQACDAIHGAHGHGIVHRDLKPGNLYLAKQPDGSAMVKVVDFGISKAINLTPGLGDGPTLTQTDSILGSPKYMSPEQLRNPKSVDARSDIWSMGIILYRLVSNRMPFDGESLGAYITMVVSERPTPLGGFVSPELERVILRCLAKEPRHRYQSIATLVAALEPFAPPDVAPIVARIADRTLDALPADAPQELQSAPPLGRTSLPPDLIASPALASAGSGTISMASTTSSPRPAKNTGWFVAGAVVVVAAIAGVVGFKYVENQRAAPTNSAVLAAAPRPVATSAGVASASPSVEAVVSANAPAPSGSASAKPVSPRASGPATAAPQTPTRTSKGPLSTDL